MAALTVLIAGPYRSGTGDDPILMAKNLRFLEQHALAVYRKGHLPLIGEWVALPLITCAGSKEVGDEQYVAHAYPVAERLIARCDTVLRVGGESRGADGDVSQARARGIPVYRSVNEIPDA